MEATFEVRDLRNAPFGFILRGDVDSDAFRSMTASELRVYCVLVVFANARTGKAWPLRKTIAEMAGIEPVRVSEAIGGLRDRGFVVITKDGRRNIYELLTATR